MGKNRDLVSSGSRVRMAFSVLGLKPALVQFPIIASPACSFGGGRSLNLSSVSPSCSKTYCTRASKSTTPPWLMLPPANEGGDMVYKFYNLADDKIETGVKLPWEHHDDAVLVGSSHGWLALFNRRDNRVILLNPLTGRQLSLPPIHTLPNPEINLKHGIGSVSKVVLSCSPDDQDDDDDDIMCRAMISFGPGDRLAFCSLPQVGDDCCWTPIGSVFFIDLGVTDISIGRPFDDFVFCGKNKLFTCITNFVIDLDGWIPFFPSDLENWDLRDPASPTSTACSFLSDLRIEGDWLTDQDMSTLRVVARQEPYIVRYNDQLFIVSRFVHKDDPCKTLNFCVLKVVYGGRRVDKLRLADSFDGSAMFLGINHSFAVPAAEFVLNPNSIYFTDVPSKHRIPSAFTYNIEIFDYENKTFVSPSPCPAVGYDFFRDQSFTKGLVPPPVWFTPSCL